MGRLILWVLSSLQPLVPLAEAHCPFLFQQAHLHPYKGNCATNVVEEYLLTGKMHTGILFSAQSMFLSCFQQIFVGYLLCVRSCIYTGE